MEKNERTINQRTKGAIVMTVKEKPRAKSKRRKTDAELFSVKFITKMPRSLREQIERAAERSLLTPSAYVRAAVLAALDREKESAA